MLGIVSLWIAAYLSGTLFCKIAGEKETSQLWKHLIGFFFLIFCQGCVFFLGQLRQWNFRKTAEILAFVYVLICCISVLVCRKELAKVWRMIKENRTKRIPYGRYQALFLWLLLGIVLVVVFQTGTNRSDAMVETVQTTLMTDTMNLYHPFTREPLELGVVLSKKIITLPFWYSALSLWTGLDAVVTVWGLGTCLTIICSYIAFGELGGLLFFRDFKKTWLLLVLMELLCLSGDYCIRATGYRQLFYSYSGEMIVASVTIPCIFCMLYRFCGPYLRNDFPKEKEQIRIWSLISQMGLCIVSCFFLTSFVWGAAMVLTAVVLFAVSAVIVGLINSRYRKMRGENRE